MFLELDWKPHPSFSLASVIVLSKCWLPIENEAYSCLVTALSPFGTTHRDWIVYLQRYTAPPPLEALTMAARVYLCIAL